MSGQIGRAEQQPPTRRASTFASPTQRRRASIAMEVDGLDDEFSAYFARLNVDAIQQITAR